MSYRYISAKTLFGLPLVSIATGPDPSRSEPRGHARGFIAIGDIATGFFALGGVARGAIAFAVYLLTQHTAFGRHLYAIGGNAEAALVSGIPVRRVVIVAFAIMGGIVAVTGFLLTSYTGNSTADLGEWMELDAVAACVIGGVSLRGGRGTVLGVLFGALIMACLLNGMTLMAVTPEFKLIARGTVLLAAVWMDVRLGRG